jgi:hypothetical protein
MDIQFLGFIGVLKLTNVGVLNLSLRRWSCYECRVVLVGRFGD